MKLDTQKVRFIEAQIFDDISLPDIPDELAPKTLSYIEGIHIMANAIVQAILELEGK